MANADDVKLLKRGYHALSQLTMHVAGHCNLSQARFDECWDIITAILELANNEKYRCRVWNQER